MRKLKKSELKRVYGAGNEDSGPIECDDDTNPNDTIDSDKEGVPRCENH